MDKLVIKNNKFKMKNKTVSNKTRGGALGSLVGIALVAVGGYFGIPVPEEIATEVAGGVVALVSFIGAWISKADDPNTIEEVKE